MGFVYLGALIVGAGIVLLQLLMSSGDSDVHGGGDATLDVHDGAHARAHHVDAGGVLAIVLSLRFWTFAALGFGLMGALVHYLSLASTVPGAVIAALTGVASGAIASIAFRAIARSVTHSGGEAHDLLGQVGKVLVPCGRGRRGKVRLVVRGQTLEYLATTDDAELGVGTPVLIEEIRGDGVHVSRAPPELTG